LESATVPDASVARQTAVIGAGAWGTALADLLARNGHAVTVWAYEPDVAEAITRRHENPRFLPDVALAPSVRATSDLASAVDGASLVCAATPSHLLRGILRKAVPHLAPAASLCVASKGIETDTLALMSVVATEEAPDHPVVALSGPSFAAEVAARQPTAQEAEEGQDRVDQDGELALPADESLEDLDGIELDTTDDEEDAEPVGAADDDAPLDIIED